jgi:APA family basic amino acid/polyamine antiporter
VNPAEAAPPRQPLPEDAPSQESSDQDAAAKGRLLQLLGFSFGLAGAVGGTLGAGILRTPGLVAAEMGSVPWFLAAWVTGGIYALLGAICATELGTSLPRAGGWMVYAQRAFGPRVGFSVGWIDWLGHSAGLAWVALTIGEYSMSLLPAAPCGPRPIAVAVLSLFALIQLGGVRAGGGALQLLSLAKALAFIVLVAACFLLGGGLSEQLAAESLIPSISAGREAVEVAPAASALAARGVFPIAAVVVALQAVITTFDGWHSPIYFAEEFADPQRDLPRSLIGGVVAIATIYLLVNLALLHVLPLSAIAASKLPVADAARLIFGGTSSTFITVLVVVSLLGLVNATIMAAPRILYGLARDGLLSGALARVNAGGTPVQALLMTALTACGLVLAGDFQILLGVASFLYVLLYLSGIVALLVLRRREPDLARPFRTWAYPLPALVVLLGSAAFLLAACLKDSRTSLLAAALVAVAFPIQWMAQRLEGEQG